MRDRRSLGLTLAIAAAVFWVCFDGATYEPLDRLTLGSLLWWAILFGVAGGILPLRRPGTPALVSGALLAAFTAWTGLSIAWAPSAERAFAELNRAALLLGVFVIAVMLGTRRTASSWANGFALAIAGIGVLALASRLFADAFPLPATAEVLQPDASRLDYPLNYANGLAILLAIGVPFLLRAATHSRPLVLQAIAVGMLPALAATVYLTSSRGGTATAIIVAVAYVTLVDERAAALAAVFAGALGSAGAVYVLLERKDLVNRPLQEAATAQARYAAPLILGFCVLAGIAYLGIRLLLARIKPRVRSALAVAAAALLLPVLVVGVIVVDPVERFNSCREPSAFYAPTDDPSRSHLLSLNGAGRWQYWKASAEQLREHPIVGQGAGSYEAWWAEHGELSMFIRDAHSLYAETLGELGIIGFLLLVASFLVALVTLLSRTRRTAGQDRALLAAFGAAFVGFAVGAGVDWIWELTAVSLVGIACLGLLMGPASSPESDKGEQPSSRRLRITGRAVLALAAFAAVASQAIALISETELRASYSASARGDAVEAIESAQRAWALQPWAASPPLQVALVAERAGELEVARVWIDAAVERDRSDWRLWLVKARLETLSGRIAEARRSLARAADLNPRSPLFADIATAQR